MTSRNVWRTLASTTVLSILILLVGCSIGTANISTPYITKTRMGKGNIPQVFVPAGCFTMGSDPAKDNMARQDEQPQHKVCITHDFWIDRDEVTNESYQQFVDDGSYEKPQFWSAEGWHWLEENKIAGPKIYDSSLNQPKQTRIGINWYEASAYANWRGGRLPSEAEWEYAARGPQSPIFPWGNQWDGNNMNYTSGQSWVGAYNMGCNALEWVADWYDPNYYQISTENDPSGSTTGVSHILRGGYWDGFPSCTRVAAEGRLARGQRRFSWY